MDCLIHELHGLLDCEWQAHIFHVIRSANMVVDFLAKIGATLEAGLQEWTSPPEDLHVFLSCDMTT